MHAERSENMPLEDRGNVERAVMLELLTGEHGLWTQAELERAISRPHGNPTPVVDAIARLHDMGLIHVFDEYITPTRAARHMDQLTI